MNESFGFLSIVEYFCLILYFYNTLKYEKVIS